MVHSFVVRLIGKTISTKGLDNDTDFLSYIFSVSGITKIIHLIMMIWLLSFIVSNYKLASGPPKDPGGSKKILSKSRI